MFADTINLCLTVYFVVAIINMYSTFIASFAFRYVGFSITRNVNMTYMTVVSASVVLALLLLTWMFKPASLDQIEMINDR